MATIVLHLDTRNKKAKKFPLVLRLTHKGKPKMISLNIKLDLLEWDSNHLKIKKSVAHSSRLNTQIFNKYSLASQVIDSYSMHLENLTVYELADLIKERIDKDRAEKEGVLEIKKTYFKEYGEKVREIYRNSKQFWFVTSIDQTINSLIQYYGSDKLTIKEIDEFFLLSYVADCQKRGMKVNGYGYYLRIIRRVYNLAIKDKSTELRMEDYPFGKGGYSIKSGKAKKRAVSTDYLKELRLMNYEKGTLKWDQRNYILFMFNTRGMNFIDLAYLKQENLVNGRLKYRRRKTSRHGNVKEFDIKLNEEALAILSIYKDENRVGGLLFPVLERGYDESNEAATYREYQNRRAHHTYILKKIGEDINLPIKLTSYVIRHTFATAGLRKGVSKALIGDMLGHTNYYTTEAYFDGFEQEALDDAADAILG